MECVLQAYSVVQVAAQVVPSTSANVTPATTDCTGKITNALPVPAHAQPVTVECAILATTGLTSAGQPVFPVPQAVAFVIPQLGVHQTVFLGIDMSWAPVF